MSYKIDICEETQKEINEAVKTFMLSNYNVKEIQKKKGNKVPDPVITLMFLTQILFNIAMLADTNDANQKQSLINEIIDELKEHVNISLKAYAKDSSIATKFGFDDKKAH